VSENHDRLYQVMRGTLFVFVEGAPSTIEGVTKPTRDIKQIQAGGVFRAPKGLQHGVAASGTNDVEVLITEDSDYEWTQLEGGVQRAVTTVPTAATPDAPINRRREANQAMLQAEKMKAERRRRRPRGPATAANAAGQRVGVHSANNANSANVEGVNPMPEIPREE